MKTNVAFAANQGLNHQIIKCYLSAIRHLQIECGGGDLQSMPLVVLALRGTKLEQAGLEKRTRLPITQVIPGAVAKSTESRSFQPRPCYVVGCVLCRVLWVPTVRRDDDCSRGR